MGLSAKCGPGAPTSRGGGGPARSTGRARLASTVPGALAGEAPRLRPSMMSRPAAAWLLGLGGHLPQAITVEDMQGMWAPLDHIDP